MSTIFEALRRDHDHQRMIVQRVLETKGDSEDRRTLFEQLRTQLTAHAGAEERYFYGPLMDHDVTQEHARHSVAEHKELDDFVEKLESYDMSSSQWLITATELADRLVHHLDEEEREIFPVAGKLLSQESKEALANSYRSDMERRLSGDRDKLT